MANYRPRSLDELNSLYGKSNDAKNEIVKNASKLEEKKEEKETAFADEELPVREKSREQIASDEIASLVNDFIKSFGVEEPIKTNRPVTVTAGVSKISSGVKNPDTYKIDEAEKESAPNEKEGAEKPRLIRNSERNSLFENYKRIMDDDDDFDFSDSESESHKKKSKPKKHKFDKKLLKITHNDAPVVTPEAVADVTAAAAAVSEPSEPEKPVAEASVSDSVSEPVQQSVTENAPVKEYPPAETYTDQTPAAQVIPEAAPVSIEVPEQNQVLQPQENFSYAQNSEDCNNEEFYNNYASFYGEEDVIPAQPTKKKNAAGQIVLLLMLLAVLLSATAVSAIKAFSGTNSDSMFMNRFYIFTADASYTEAAIEKGSLVICKPGTASKDDVIAYKKGEGSYSFAKVNSRLNSESLIAVQNGEQLPVFDVTARGTVINAVPFVGTVVALIMTHFLPVIAAFLLLAFIIILILALGFKGGESKKASKKESVIQYSEEAEQGDENAYAYDIDGEDYQEEFDEYPHEEYSEDQPEEEYAEKE